MLSRNTAIGHNADVSQGDLTNAIVDASYKIQLGDDNVTEVQINGYTKLGTSPPAHHLPPTTMKRRNGAA